jgi:hypothetical protein
MSLGFYCWILLRLGFDAKWAWGYHNPMALNNYFAYGLGRVADAATLPLYSFLKGLYVDIWMFVNSFWFSIKYFAYDKATLKAIAESGINSAQASNGSRIMQAIGTFTNMPVIGAVVKMSTTLSIVFVFIRFAKIILYAFYLNSSTSNLTFEGLAKKLIMSLLATFLAPYLMLNGICLSASAGLALGNSVFTASMTDDAEKEAIGENIVLSYYYFSRNYGIKASTFCDDSSDRSEEESVTALYGPYNSTSLEGVVSFPQKVSPQNDNMAIEGVIWEKFCSKKLQSDEYSGKKVRIMPKINRPGESIDDLWDFVIGGDLEDVSWKGTYPARIGQVLIDYDVPGSDLFLIHHDLKTISGEALLLFIIEFAYIIFITLSVMRNCLEILSLCLMSWNYIGTYVSSGKSDSLARLAKNAGRQMLNQFYICAMFGIFSALFASDIDYGMKVAFGFLIILISMGGAGSIVYDVGSATGPQDFTSASSLARQTYSVTTQTYNSFFRNTIKKKD